MMALSRSMKNLMHDAATARKGGGNPNPTGGGMSGMMGRAVQQASEQYNPGGKPRPGPTRGPRGPVVPTGGGTMGAKPRPTAGDTFGFAARGGGGTPALQQAKVQAKRQSLSQRAAGPAALAQPRGQDLRQRVGARQGPPARRGGMARAYGSGGSRRRMLR